MTAPRRAFQTLVSLHLRQMRSTRAAIVIQTVVIPLGIISSAFALNWVRTPEQHALITADALVLAIMGATLLTLPSALAQQRESGQITYIAALPVGRVTWLAAQLAANALIALPGIVLTYLLAIYLEHGPSQLSVGMLFIVPLAFLSLAAIGALIGLLASNTSVATAVGYLVFLFLLVGVGFPFGTGQLASLVQVMSALLPGYLASDAVAAFIPDSGAHSPVVDIILLALYAGVGLYLASRAIPWRVEGRADAPLVNPHTQP